MSEKRIIEINGQKFEVDMRRAVKIENFKVGDKVKVLKKQYSDSYASYAGLIIGFEPFKETPTIVIAYLESEYSKADIKFIYFNDKLKDVEICPMEVFDMPIEKAQVIDKFNQEILKLEDEKEKLKAKRSYFINQFGKYFEDFPTDPELEKVEKQSNEN